MEMLGTLDGEVKVVMEHTGNYYESIANVLHESGLWVSAVNPLLIRNYGDNSLRSAKTDKAGAKKIARYTLDNWEKLRQYTPMDTIRYQLKTLNRRFQLASKNRTACSNNLSALMEQSYPGVRSLFSSPVRPDGSQKWVDFANCFLARGLRCKAQPERFCREIPEVVQALRQSTRMPRHCFLWFQSRIPRNCWSGRPSLNSIRFLTPPRSSVRK